MIARNPYQIQHCFVVLSRSIGYISLGMPFNHIWRVPSLAGLWFCMLVYDFAWWIPLQKVIIYLVSYVTRLFFCFTSRREPEEPEDATKGRDVFNEKPPPEELLSVSDLGKTATTSLPDNLVCCSLNVTLITELFFFWCCNLWGAEIS